jgi:hypothetical protein
MTLKWIAQRFEMADWTNVSNLLPAKRKQESLKSAARARNSRKVYCFWTNRAVTAAAGAITLLGKWKKSVKLIATGKRL